jgi:hypothetical protein
MDEGSARRTAGIAGIATGLLLLVAFVVPGAPPAPDDPLRDITSFFADKHNTLRVSMVLISLAAASFLVFLGVVVAMIRSREGVFAPYASVAALTGAATIIAVTVTLSAFIGAAYRAGPDGNDQAVRALFDFSNELGTVVNATGAVAMATASLAVRRFRVLPGWAATTGLVAAALTAIGELGLLADKGAFAPGGVVAGLAPTLGALVWTVSWGLALLRSETQPASA